jgi:hypothetical protein
MGLTINQEKTKFMKVSNKKTKEKHITINNKNIEKVNEFQYLGFIVTCDSNVGINHRRTMRNKCYYGLTNLLRSKPMKDTKCKIHKTLIKPVELYGSESWTLTKVNKDKLKIF